MSINELGLDYLYLADSNKIKLTEERRQNAEKALRNLNNESQHEILYEFTDTSLLPDDFDKRSPDNMIVSAALV